MPMYSSLTRALAEALVDVLWFVEGCEDEQMDPDDAVKVLEGVAHLVAQLSSDQRSEFIDLLGSMATEEADPSAPRVLGGVPLWFGTRRGRLLTWDLCVEQDALAEEFEARATEHLTLEHLDPVDVAFDDAGVPGL